MIPCGGFTTLMRQLPLLSAITRGRLFFNMSVKIMSEVFERSRTQGNARLVLLALADSCNDDACCWPSIRKLADKANVSEPILKKYLNALIEVGVVSREEREDSFGRQTSNLYTINVERIGSDWITQNIIHQASSPSRIKSVEGVTRVSGGGGNPDYSHGGVTSVSLSIMNRHKEPKIEPSQQTVLKSIDLISIKPKTKRKPKLVDDAFITELKRLNPDKDVDKEVQMARTWILAKPNRQFTQQFLSGWINRSKNTIKPERFSNF
jgi:predicted transcriptional regulator